MKKILFLLLLISTSAFAQVEHGLLVGAGVGFPLQDSWKRTTWGLSLYTHLTLPTILLV